MEVRASTQGAQTVDRALAVLSHIVDQDSPVLLDDLASRLGLNTGGVYRAVRSLVAAGLVRREPVGGGYTVGTALISMAVAISSRIDIRAAAKPAMQMLVAEFGETVSLHIRSGDKRICVEVVDGVHHVRRVVPVGEALPLYAGETGRIFLASLPPGELEERIEAATKNGIDGARLRRDILSAKKRGYFIGIGERTPNVGSISVALDGPTTLLGVLTISGPSVRWSRAAMEAACPRILELTNTISQRAAGDRSVRRNRA